MSLPTVMIFERHWDRIPKLLVKEILPDLAQKGYDTFCVEVSQDLPSDEIALRLNSGIEFDEGIEAKAIEYLARKQVTPQKQLSDISFKELTDLMHLHVSSQRYLEVAEKIKQLPAARVMQEIFGRLEQLSIAVKGIDISDFDAIVAENIGQRYAKIVSKEDERIATMFKNLQALRAQKRGVIFSCGALHAERLIAEFEKEGIADDLLYYFPHSWSRPEDSFDDMRDLHATNPSLRGHTHLLVEQTVPGFSKRVIADITNKLRYKEEVTQGNAHIRFLSDLFGVEWQAFLRSQSYLDALVDKNSPQIEAICKSLQKVAVATRDVTAGQNTYLAIPNVNTKEVADKIRKISLTQ